MKYWLVVAVLLALGSWLRAPALDATLVSDDWDHYAMATGVYPVARAPWDFYDFIGDSAAERFSALISSSSMRSSRGMRAR